jgi:hypothetical protein
MFDVFENCATDEVRELEGSWVSFGGGSSILVARAENENYTRRIIEVCDKNRAVLDLDNEESKELDRRLMIQVIAETVLLGWKDFSYKGKKINYSVETASKLLKHQDFRKKVMSEAYRFENYRVKAEVADVKN